MTDRSVLQDFLGQGEPRRPLFAMYALVVLLMSYHALVFTVIKADEISTKDDLTVYQISFSESTISASEDAYVQDQTVTMEFEIEEDDLVGYNGMGLLSVVVSYSETSGLPFDGCDTVSASIPPNGPSADWGHENSTLSGTSDDCSDIVLNLVVFPDYSGDEITIFGGVASQHEEAWSSQTHGLGKFTLNIDVSASSPAPSPSPQDDGEAVSVTWMATFFDLGLEEQ
ncbi:MAG TPA: hypothetical protein D7I05_03305 [Candidatus Poseidoniales archaeon]|nr:MAG TPA: hypothetical protein D7I05_03305 [Candidatus Poseidoniales archaeon]